MVFARSVALLLFLTLEVVTALPDGTPACFVGQPSFNDVHLKPTYAGGNSTVTNGSIATGGIELYIGNVLLDPSLTHTFQANMTYNVMVKGATNQQYKGFQLVLASAAGTDVRGALLPTWADIFSAPLSESALGCEKLPYSGVSHAANSLKRSSNMTLSMATVHPNLTLDLTVVMALNSVQGSIYYYTQYKLASVAPPTNAPTKAPTGTKAPTKVPVAPTAPTAPVAPTAPTAPTVPVATTPVAPTVPVATMPVAPTVPVAPAAAPALPKKQCGLLRLSIFCPLTRCGVFGRAFGLCQEN